MAKVLRILFIAVLLGCGVYWLIKRGPRPGKEKPETAQNVARPAAPYGAKTNPAAGDNRAASPIPIALPDHPAIPTLAGSASSNNPARPYILGSPSGPPANMDPRTILENARLAVVNYGDTFDGNPVGTNPEITSALNGENPKQIKFLSAENGMRINGNGELVDSWGTPLFFHQLSGHEMEIRSAGPDQLMWTTDDLVIK